MSPKGLAVYFNTFPFYFQTFEMKMTHSTLQLQCSSFSYLSDPFFLSKEAYLTTHTCKGRIYKRFTQESYERAILNYNHRTS
ncbi:hypothetical protein POVWA2_019560 [Plasmodium ovale wallikeri]|uniref:Uncharacterized protein n=1 Tax=Plasmodium ovale wallikeri TaxID=864142 RepID=A0A1A8YSA4_PLAOA|nr:hypothetical protein POVWA2_019560 [Plasmodium ovale wallikeri]